MLSAFGGARLRGWFKSEAARKYAQSAGMGLDIQNHAAEVKLLAERKAGELLESDPNEASRNALQETRKDSWQPDVPRERPPKRKPRL